MTKDEVSDSVKQAIIAYAVTTVRVSNGEMTVDHLTLAAENALSEVAQFVDDSVIDLLRSPMRNANFLRDECYEAAFKAGWWNVPTYGEPYSGRKEDVRRYPSHILRWWISTKIALIHSELSEALEGARKDKMDDHLPHLKSINVEMADAVIRIMDLCGGLGIDIGHAIAEKLAYNAQRADHKPENRDKAGGKAF